MPCPLGDGEAGVTWNTVDTDTDTFEQSNTLLTDHVKYAHQICADMGEVSRVQEGTGLWFRRNWSECLFRYV